jgi:hypothetical protein
MNYSQSLLEDPFSTNYHKTKQFHEDGCASCIVIYTFNFNNFINILKGLLKYFDGLFNDIGTNIYLLFLEKNIIYYEQTKNIAFTDLMLNKYVHNYVSFTGTAYINPPMQFDNHNYNKYDFIRQEPIHGAIEYRNTEEAIYEIIKNNTIIKNFYMDLNTNTLNNIKNCLLKSEKGPIYNVLIDVGAFFVMYDDKQMIEWVKEIGIYEYFVYFDKKMYYH